MADYHLVPNPFAAGIELAEKVLARISDDDSPPPRRHPLDALGDLIAWADIERDSRWIDIHITVDSLTGDAIYAVEAHAVDLGIVYYGAGRTLSTATGRTLALIRPKEDPSCL